MITQLGPGDRVCMAGKCFGHGTVRAQAGTAKMGSSSWSLWNGIVRRDMSALLSCGI